MNIAFEVLSCGCEEFCLNFTCFPLRQPGFELGSGHVGFVVDRVVLGGFSQSTSGSPASCSTITIYHLGLVQ
jgi:hypothetical protein